MAQFLTVNDVTVLNGSISMPLTGAFTADLVLNQKDVTNFEAGTAVTIRADKGLTLQGTVLPDRSGAFLNTAHVRIIGGNGGLSGSTTPRGFTQPGAYVRDVLSALAGQSGETLSTTIASSFLGTNLIAWAILQGKISEAIKVLIDTVAPTSHWRILADGTLWIGTETWPETVVDYVVDVHNPSDASYMLAVNYLQIYPGISVEGIGRIERVEHLIMPDKVRTQVWTFVEDEQRGLAAAINSLVQFATAHVDYFAMYDAKVISQSGSTVDVKPVDSRLPGMSKVPLRLGIPGASVQVAPGATLRIGWDRGNPQYPFAALWNGGETVTQETLEATLLNLGGTGGQFIALSTKVQNYLIALASAFTAWTPVPMDGGAALKTALATAGVGASWGSDVAATKVKAV